MAPQVTQMLLPLTAGPGGLVNRPGTAIAPRHIVVHRTGNVGAGARANRDWFARGQVYGSAHYCVDSEEIIQCIPETERAYHVAVQNRSTDGMRVDVALWSIGIETCEPCTPATYEKLVALCGDICQRYGLSPEIDITPHSFWDPKDRPYDPVATASYANKTYDPNIRITLLGKDAPGDLFSWPQFVADVNRYMSGGVVREIPDRTEGAAGTAFTDVTGHWAQSFIQEVAQAGLLKGDPDGKFRPDDPVTRAELAVVLSRLLKRS